MDVTLKGNLDVETIKRVGKMQGAEVEAEVYAHFMKDMMMTLLAELKSTGIHPEILEDAAGRVALDLEAVKNLLY